MGPLISALLSAFIPVAVEGAKQGINKITGGPKAYSIDDQIKLEQSDVAKLEALAKLDNPYGTPSQWVVDLRASMRYLAAAAVIVVGLGGQFVPDMPLPVRAALLEAASIAFGFLFGTRIVANLRK